MRRIVAGLGIALCLVAVNAYAAIWYVDMDNAGTQNGTSWATAFTTIQQAVDAAFAVGGGEVWVAEGTYTATTDPVLTMKFNVNIYGGFIGLGTGGNETTRSQRNWTNHLTTIDGEDARRCVIGGSLTTLDGFTVTRGNGMFSPQYYGGGMYNDNLVLTVSNCTFSNNSASGGGGGMYNSTSSLTITNSKFFNNSSASGSGGGMHNSGSAPMVSNCEFSINSAYEGGGMFNNNSSPTVTNCTFSANTSSTNGGGISNCGASPTISACTFTGNSTSGEYGGGNGGAVYSFFATPAVMKCTFYGNLAHTSGGGMFNSNSSPTVTNCIFSRNATAAGPPNAGGIHNHLYSGPTMPAIMNCTFYGHMGVAVKNENNSDAVITNCIMWDSTGGEISNYASTPVVTYCDVQGASLYAGTGNIMSDPLFVDAVNGDLRLGEGSPCIDTGTATGAPTTDILGVTRPQGVGFDMGAYEKESSTPPPSDVAITTNGGQNFSTWDPNLVLGGTCPAGTSVIRVNGSTVGVTYTPGATTWSFTKTLQGGANMFSVVALDGSSAQLGAAAMTVTLNIVATPVITTNGGRNFSANTSALTLQGTCSSDAAHILVNGSMNGVTYTPSTGAWSFAGTLTAGANTFNVTAQDGVGHLSATATITVTLDVSVPDAPVITTNGGSDYATNVQALTLQGTCTVSAGQIQVNGSTSGVSFTPGSTSWSFSTTLTEGPNSFSVAAIGQGSTASDPDTITVKLDTVAPRVARAGALSLSQVRVVFNEEMANNEGLLRTACYSLGETADSPKVTGVSRIDAFTVELAVAGLVADTAYTLEVSTLVPTDLAGNFVAPAGNTAPFTVPGTSASGSTYYVGGVGASDTTGDGTAAKPWATIAKAMTTVGPLSSALSPSTIRLAPGVYDEPVVFSAHVYVVGSGPGQTTIRHYAASDDEHVVARAANDTALRDCKLTFPGTHPAVLVLLVIDDVQMEINNVLFDGGLNQNSTGVLVSKHGSSDAVISDSTIVNLNDGIWVVDSGIVITRNAFDSILNNAIFALRPTTKNGDGATPAVGDSTKPCTSGLNRFGTVGRFCLMSLNSTTVLAQQNDWGVYEDSLVASKVSGNVDIENYIGRNLAPGTIVVAALDAKSLTPIPSSDNPAVFVTSTTPNVNGELDVESGLFLILLCPVAKHTVKGTAIGHVPDSQDVEVQAEKVATAVLHLVGKDEARDINEDVKIDAIDIQLVINGALGLPIDLGLIPDVNRDGKIDAVDIQLVINGALGLPVVR